MTDTDGPSSEHSRRPRRIRKRDGWLRDRHDSTAEEQQLWNKLGLPPHSDIVGSFLASNDYIFGVPDKAELYRLDGLTKESDKLFAGTSKAQWKKTLRLFYVEQAPQTDMPDLRYTVAHPPLGMDEGKTMEVTYNVRVSALVHEMCLTNIHVVHGSPSDEDYGIVFEGAEFPLPESRRVIRVVRVTVLGSGIGRWETVSETRY